MNYKNQNLMYKINWNQLFYKSLYEQFKLAITIFGFE
jgi:hypothetical protein